MRFVNLALKRARKYLNPTHYPRRPPCRRVAFRLQYCQPFPKRIQERMLLHAQERARKDYHHGTKNLETKFVRLERQSTEGASSNAQHFR